MSDQADMQQRRKAAGGWKRTAVCWTVGVTFLVAAACLVLPTSTLMQAVRGGFVLSGIAACVVAGLGSPRQKLRLAALLVSFAMAIFLCELMLRMVTSHPINATSNMIPHPDLGYVLDPRLHDVDENGFRNPVVRREAALVTIGDSHTQGFNATSEGSWPAQLGRLTDRSVYNFGVGGYGPLHYKRVLQVALLLNPKVVIVGLYLGNDFGDVNRGIRTRHSAEEVEHSVLNVLKFRTATGSFCRELWNRSAAGRPPGQPLPHPLNPTHVADQRMAFLTADMNLSDDEIRTAFGRTMQILAKMQRAALEGNSEFIVLLIPTRESVYVHADRELQQYGSASLQRLAAVETRLRTAVIDSLRQDGVFWVDLLTPLASALNQSEGLYSAYDEGHPLAGGYEVYAKSLCEDVRRSSARVGDLGR